MIVRAIRELVESASLADLRAAEQALLNGSEVSLEIEGKDASEQLTHVLAAIFIHEELLRGSDMASAMRKFANRVRSSTT